MLSWQPPERDGGSPLTGFIIEKRERKSTWAIGKTDSKMTHFHVTKLTPGTQYLFCVVAKNDVGCSKPLATEVVATRTQTGKYFLVFNSFRVLMLHHTQGFCICKTHDLGQSHKLGESHNLGQSSKLGDFHKLGKSHNPDQAGRAVAQW